MILFDTGILGILINSELSKNNKSEVDSCTRWLNSLLAQKIWVAIPEIADYEQRRELIRPKIKPA